MNFLFLAGGAAINGMEIVLHSLMAGLNQRGHHAAAIVSGWNNGDYPRMLAASAIDYREIELGRIHLLRPNWTRGTYYSLPKAIADIRAFVAEVEPDWMIFSEPQSLLLCAHILPSVPKALYLHNRPERFLSHVLGGAMRRRIRRLICVSDFVAQCARKTPLRHAELTVVHNGIAAPQQDWPISAQLPVRLGIVGGLGPQKQHLVLVQAMARLKQRLPPGSFRLVIVGNKQGSYVNKVEARIAQLGLHDVVSWTGFVRDRDEIYGGLDILVAPAINEGFGLTVAEAAAYGRPAVAARSGAFPEVVQEGRTGLLFKPGDAGELALMLERLIVDGELRQRMGQAAQSYVRTAFTVEQMTERFIGALGGAA